MESYKRDKTSGAIINTSGNSLQRYKQIRDVRRKKTQNINDLNERLEKLEKIVQKLTENK